MRYLFILALLTGCVDRLQQINNKVNQNPYIPRKYDCRSFVEDKYNSLLLHGYKDMKFVITSHNNEPHVVLKVDGQILDNNYKYPYPATKEMQGGLNYQHWSYYRSK